MTYINFADEPTQEERIAKLRQEVEKLGGSTMSLESMPADMEEEFLRHVLEYENAEPISLLRLLENSGLEVPAAPSLVPCRSLSRGASRRSRRPDPSGPAPRRTPPSRPRPGS